MTVEANQDAITILNAKVANLTANLNILTANLAAVDAREAANEAATTAEVNTFYLLWAGALIFLMQALRRALGRLDPHEERQEHPAQEPLDACWVRANSAARVQPINRAQNLDARAQRALRAGAVGWYTLGYGFAYQSDDNPNPFIGGGPSTFALSGEDDTSGTFAHGYGYIAWWFQYAFAAAAATIVSGAVAERCKRCARRRLLGARARAHVPDEERLGGRSSDPRRPPPPSPRRAAARARSWWRTHVYTFLITSFIYPVVVHWVWDTNGFLCAWGPNAIGRFTDGDGAEQIVGMIDFAGSGVVHMTGGFAALMGAKILGRRIGRFEEPEHLYQGHSSTLQARDTPATPPPAAPRPPSSPPRRRRARLTARRPPSRARCSARSSCGSAATASTRAPLAAHGTLNDLTRWPPPRRRARR